MAQPDYYMSQEWQQSKARTELEHWQWLGRNLGVIGAEFIKLQHRFDAIEAQNLEIRNLILGLMAERPRRRRRVANESPE